VRAVALAVALAVVGCGEPEAESTGSEDIVAGDEWTELARRSGLVRTKGRGIVIGVRGRSLDGTLHEVTSQHAFDDLAVVLPADGGPSVFLEASTHPFEREGVAGVPDVDQDGARDVGMIRPGRYLAKGRGARLTGGHPAFDVTTPEGSGALPGIRDTNHDGVFSAEEDDASTRRGDRITAILFHRADGGAPPAVGCQVFSPEGIDRLTELVGGRAATFDYLLVEAGSIASPPSGSSK
jgi:hypothetical protein